MPQIADTPVLSWNASQLQRVTLSPITLPAGRTLADFAAFTLTIRTDPDFPRSGTDLNDPSINPYGDGWTAAVTSTGSVSGATLVFDFTTPSAPGAKRYAVDVRATGGTAGPVVLFPATWLTITPRVT